MELRDVTWRQKSLECKHAFSFLIFRCIRCDHPGTSEEYTSKTVQSAVVCIIGLTMKVVLSLSWKAIAKSSLFDIESKAKVATAKKLAMRLCRMSRQTVGYPGTARIDGW
jgi:hypothetical protein